MFGMFNQFFSMLTNLFKAGDNLTASLVNISEISLEMSGEYADASRAARSKAKALLLA